LVVAYAPVAGGRVHQIATVEVGLRAVGRVAHLAATGCGIVYRWRLLAATMGDGTS
jgi:hypothetical protein